MGAAGRDFHNFNLCIRDNDAVEVVAFTADPDPGHRRADYPPALAGAALPAGDPDPRRGGAGGR